MIISVLLIATVSYFFVRCCCTYLILSLVGKAGLCDGDKVCSCCGEKWPPAYKKENNRENEKSWKL